MELKDKVYVHRNTFGDLLAYEEDWCRPPYCVEYTRTDVFIEKACEWLKNNVTYTHPRTGETKCVVNLNAFRDAMKGE